MGSSPVKSRYTTGSCYTSRLLCLHHILPHTALKIAPVYHAPVVHLKDASQNAGVASKLLNPQAKAELVNELEAEYQALREKSGLMKRETVSLEEAQKNKLNLF